MLSKGTQRLADDHVALDELLKQLKAALDQGNIDASFAKLDLFWAKLAVHIRAEHLHLFPCILNGEGGVIEQLRDDHEFFMRQLASAIETIRTGQGLNTVKDIVLEIEQRLAHHNQVEETNVYHLATTVLNPEQLAELSQRISSELEKRPSRFNPETWALDCL
jgi:hemerythrin-like domain-containing protein